MTIFGHFGPFCYPATLSSCQPCSFFLLSNCGLVSFSSWTLLAYLVLRSRPRKFQVGTSCQNFITLSPFVFKNMPRFSVKVLRRLTSATVCLFAHSVCANFSLIAHSVCANFGLIAHSPVYSVILLK